MQIAAPHFLDGHRHPWLHCKRARCCAPAGMSLAVMAPTRHARPGLTTARRRLVICAVMRHAVPRVTKS
jgi:hypothetical protein